MKIKNKKKKFNISLSKRRCKWKTKERKNFKTLNLKNKINQKNKIFITDFLVK